MKKISFTPFQRIIEDTNWDNELIKTAKKLDNPCWLVICIAAIYLSVVIAGIVFR